MAHILILALLIGWNSDQAGTDTEQLEHCVLFGTSNCERPTPQECVTDSECMAVCIEEGGAHCEDLFDDETTEE